MNNYFLLVISMLCALTASVIKKHSTEKFESKKLMRFFFNAVVSLTCVISFLVLSGIPKISGFTLMLGLLFGTVTAIQQIFVLMAYENGPFSYTSVIVSLSTIIPALSGYFIWGESIVTVQIIGMVLMLCCFALSVDFSKSEKKASLSWFLYVFIAFITTGLIGVMQKWHQSSEYKAELDGFLIIAFLFSFVFSAVGTLIIYRTERGKSEEKKPLRDITAIMLVFMAVCGICAAANNKMNLYLSGAMDSAIFFPIVNGGGMILSTLTSLLVFKEKFNVQKCIGIAIGVIAVVLLCNPF